MQRPPLTLASSPFAAAIQPALLVLKPGNGLLYGDRNRLRARVMAEKLLEHLGQNRRLETRGHEKLLIGQHVPGRRIRLGLWAVQRMHWEQIIDAFGLPVGFSR